MRVSEVYKFIEDQGLSHDILSRVEKSEKSDETYLISIWGNIIPDDKRKTPVRLHTVVFGITFDDICKSVSNLVSKHK